jgi:hypothetical protein
MFRVIYAYPGWQNANYVLTDVRNPVCTLKVTRPLGLKITAILYIIANIAYFVYGHHVLDKDYSQRHLCSVSSKTAILEPDTTVASHFFQNIFGARVQKH